MRGLGLPVSKMAQFPFLFCGHEECSVGHCHVRIYALDSVDMCSQYQLVGTAQLYSTMASSTVHLMLHIVYKAYHSLHSSLILNWYCTHQKILLLVLCFITLAVSIHGQQVYFNVAL